MVTKSKVTLTGRSEDDGTHIDMEFSNGEKRSFHLPVTHDLYANFAAHGFGKKVRDQIAASKTAEDAVKAVDVLLGAFDEGKWNVLRNTDTSPTVGILAQALSRLYGKTLAESQSFVTTLSKKQQADLRKEPSVASMIVTINAEGGTSDEVSNLLSGFGDAPAGAFNEVDEEIAAEAGE
jgi:hypothetical protein